MKDKKWKKRIKCKYVQSVDMSSKEAQWGLERAYNLLFESVLEQDKVCPDDFIVKVIRILKEIALKKQN